MSIEAAALKDKILEIYPNLTKFGAETTVSFDSATDAWLVKLTKGEHELTTHIDVADAENCIKGIECMHLGTQVGRFIEYYCMKDDGCEV